MTLIDLQAILLKYFYKNNKFSLDENIKDLFLTNEYSSSFNKSFVEKGLDGLVELGLLCKIEEVKNKTISKSYVLLSPLNKRVQTVQIGGDTALLISEIINSYCRIKGDTNSTCDALMISEKDIENVCRIAGLIFTNNEGAEDE